LWTVSRYPGKGVALDFNHFVPLLPLSSVAEVCAETELPERQEDASPSCVNQSDDSDTEDIVCSAADGQTLDRRFLSLSDCVTFLRDGSPGLEHIPTGVKNNMWFKVNVHISLYA